MQDGQLEAKGGNGKIGGLEGQEDLEDVKVVCALSGWHALASIVRHLQNEIPPSPHFRGPQQSASGCRVIALQHPSWCLSLVWLLSLPPPQPQCRGMPSRYRLRNTRALPFPCIHWDMHAIEHILGTAEIRQSPHTIVIVLALVRTRFSVF